MEQVRVKYETPEGKTGTLRIPKEWAWNAEDLFWPNRILGVEEVEQK